MQHKTESTGSMITANSSLSLATSHISVLLFSLSLSLSIVLDHPSTFTQTQAREFLFALTTRSFRNISLNIDGVHRR
jgi:hypothetical protein